MPTYTYECPVHGEFEHFHSITEQLELCPMCEEEGKVSSQVKKLISPGSSFILKGGGWAADNYK